MAESAESLAGATLPVATSAQVRSVVLVLLKRHRGRSAAVALVFLAASGLGLVAPACLGGVVDAVAADAGPTAVTGWVAGAGAGAIGAAVLMLWGMRGLTSLVQDTLASLREDVFTSAMRLPVSTIDDGESADLLSRVTGDVEAVAEAGADVAPTVLSAAFAIAVSLLALSAIDPWLALAGTASVPFFVIGTRAFLRRSRVVFREVRVREAARSQAVIDAVEGAETHIALNEQDAALKRVQARAERSIDIQLEGARARNRLFRWINGGEAVGLGALLAAGFGLHATESISIGAVTTAALVFHRLFGPIGQLIFGLDDVQRAVVGLARLVGVIELAPDASAVGEGVGIRDARASAAEGRPRAGDGISLTDVAFHYPTTGRGVSGVTLQVESGSSLALVGTSGSGKSTLARVIAGHHQPDSGVLHLGDTAAAPYYISQELHSFRGTVGDGMRLVAPHASDEQIDAALREAGADWATGCAQDDGSLDDGRLQQLALARALLADPAVVILDEATADVGLLHRDAVETAMARLCAGRTSVVIAHRLQQAQSADQVVVLADGRVVQRGTHAELVTIEGRYRTFWRAQTSGHRSDPDPRETEAL